MTIFLEMITK